MLISTAYAAPAIVRYNTGDAYSQYCIMLDENGALLTPRDSYGNIYGISLVSNGEKSEFYAVAEAVLSEPVGDPDSFQVAPVALMNDKGAVLTEFEYASLTHYPDDGIVVFSRKSDLLGAMDESGNVILPERFISLVPNGRGGFLGALAPENGPINYEISYPLMYIDEKGRSFDTGYVSMPYGLSAFSEGFCSVTMSYEPDSANNVYLDFEGTNVFGKAYGWTSSFYGNYAIVQDPSADRYGLIDKTGAWAVPPEYITIDSGVYYDTGTYLACTENHAILLDAHDLHEICRIDFGDTGANYAWLSGKEFINTIGDDIALVYDTDGNFIAQGNNVDITYMHTDSKPGRIVRIEGEWPEYIATLTDFEGNVYGPQFQNLIPSSWQDGQGRYIFSTYSFKTETDGQRVPDWGSYRFGLCDQDGNILLEPIYTSMDTLYPNRYWVRMGSRTGMIDDHGAWLYAIDDYEYLMD